MENIIISMEATCDLPKELIEKQLNRLKLMYKFPNITNNNIGDVFLWKSYYLSYLV